MVEVHVFVEGITEIEGNDATFDKLAETFDEARFLKMALQKIDFS